jgi:di/tripeptidase
VGVVEGGTSINSIAAQAKMWVDMRSNELPPLLAIEKELLAAVKQAVVEENARWNSDKITVDIKMVGDRPAGTQPADTSIVQAMYAATVALGIEPELEGPASTDANLPISLGIPALCIGGGGRGGNGHAFDEWYENVDAYLGTQNIFLTILGLAGVDGVTQPLLEVRAK